MSNAQAGREENTLHRVIGWPAAFWVAAGVPALVLFSIGGIAATVGTPSWVIWIVSVAFGFIQAHIYAEIAGLFPSKSGGASVYGASAWVRYSKLIAPLSVWCNWVAWTPVLAIGSGLAAGYILNAFAPVDSTLLTWHITLVDLGFLKEGLTLRINATFFIGVAVLLVVFAIQHRGILSTARIQTIVGIAVIVPLLVVGIVPFLSGTVSSDNLFPLTPIAFDEAGNVVEGLWDRHGITLFLGGLFIAAWSTYGFETTVCYTSEFRRPEHDTVRAILYSGLLCVVIFTLVPLAFQGYLGTAGIMEPGIVDGTGVAQVMGEMVGGGVFITKLMVLLLVLATMLAIMTSMAGSSRTLYQGSVDGWLPKYLSRVNDHGAPVSAMWTDLTFNLILLMMSDYLFVLAVSNCCYLIFNFLNLNAGWIHRIDNAHVKRPWRCPTIMMAAGVALSFVNMVLLGAGANVWGSGTLMSGIIAAALIIPVFAFRHYVTDKGKFPERMLEDLGVSSREMLEKKAGILPWLVLLAGVAVAAASNMYFTL